MALAERLHHHRHGAEGIVDLMGDPGRQSAHRSGPFMASQGRLRADRGGTIVDCQQVAGRLAAIPCLAWQQRYGLD
ncbi:MAG: hypothetical protein WA970_23400 [Gammaproteobacteria bacterium]